MNMQIKNHKSRLKLKRTHTSQVLFSVADKSFSVCKSFNLGH